MKKNILLMSMVILTLPNTYGAWTPQGVMEKFFTYLKNNKITPDKEKAFLDAYFSGSDFNFGKVNQYAALTELKKLCGCDIMFDKEYEERFCELFIKRLDEKFTQVSEQFLAEYFSRPQAQIDELEAFSNLRERYNYRFHYPEHQKSFREIFWNHVQLIGKEKLKNWSKEFGSKISSRKEFRDQFLKKYFFEIPGCKQNKEDALVCYSYALEATCDENGKNSFYAQYKKSKSCNDFLEWTGFLVTLPFRMIFKNY